MYEVILSNRAEKRLSRLLGGEYERVLRAVMNLPKIRVQGTARSFEAEKDGESE